MEVKITGDIREAHKAALMLVEQFSNTTVSWSEDPDGEPQTLQGKREYHSLLLTVAEAVRILSGGYDPDSRYWAGILQDRTTSVEMTDEMYPAYLAGIFEGYFRLLWNEMISLESLADFTKSSILDTAVASNLWAKTGPGTQTENAKRMIELEHQRYFQK